MSSKYNEFAYLQNQGAKAPSPEEQKQETMHLGELIQKLLALEKKVGKDTPVWIAEGYGVIPLNVIEKSSEFGIILAQFGS